MARRHQEVDRHLGGKVRLARVEKRISQTALGEKLGISFQQVQKYELGKDRISASQLMSIARILEKDIGYFFADIGAEHLGAAATSVGKPAPKTEKLYDVKIIRLLHAIEDETLKARLCNLMEAIATVRRAPGTDDRPAALAHP